MIIINELHIEQLLSTSIQLSYVWYDVCLHSHHSWDINFVTGFQLWSLFVQLIGHNCIISSPLLCHNYAITWPLIVPYAPLWGHNIGIILHLDGHYNLITWPLIKIPLIHYPYKVWICTPQVGSQCYINCIRNIYIVGTSKYSSLYT